jgi:hypothetical protein
MQYMQYAVCSIQYSVFSIPYSWGGARKGAGNGQWTEEQAEGNKRDLNSVNYYGEGR